MLGVEVITLEAFQLMDLCYLEIQSLTELRLTSDVVPVNPTDTSTDQHSHAIAFPLGEWRCTEQGTRQELMDVVGSG